MGTDYPGAIDTFARPGSGDPRNVFPTETQSFDNAFDALEAIETELGIDPAGASATVAARLSAIEAAIAAALAAAVLDGDSAGGVLAGTYPNPSFAADMATQAELDAVAAAKQSTSEKGQVNGYPSLDGTTKVPLAQLPTGTSSSTVALGDAPTSGDAAHVAAGNPHTQYERTANKGVASGYASLDAGGVLPTAQLPPLAINETFTAASQAAMLALTAQRGDMAIRTDFTPFHLFVLSSDSPSTLADWKEITAAGAVVSFNARAGAVAPASGDYTASQVTNVAAGNIASTTVQAALNELDSEKAALASAVMDGDTAGGVLSGTYPNPGFAVDMATQAELDAVAATKADKSAVVLPHTHTWAVSGEIKVPSGDTDFIVPMFVFVPSGWTAVVSRCRYVINGGTSVTAKLQKNGSDLTGFTGISVTTTAATTDPTDQSITDTDKLALVVTAVSGTPKNMSFSVEIRLTLT